MKKKIVSLCLVVCLLAVAIVGGTMAYFTDTDTQTNTMVIGHVDIAQNEYEYKSADNAEVQAFTQDKVLLPYVGEMSYANTNIKDSNANWTRFGMKNAIDKYVTVKNNATEGTTGADVYARTIIVYEMNSKESKLIGISRNDQGSSHDNYWSWDSWQYATIGYKTYIYGVATYEKAITPGTETEPSLRQFYLSKDATETQAKSLDCNGNGKFDVYALTQAVQTGGFDSKATALENAKDALDTAFGEINADKIAELFADMV